MISLTHAYGFSQEPFAQDIPLKNLYPLPGLDSFQQRFAYAVAHNLTTVITGEVGSGKSTSLRAAAATLHPSQYRPLPLIATTGSLLELLRQICFLLGDPPASNSAAKMLALIRSLLIEITSRKQTPLLLLDEAHLLRLDVFAQLHILTQLDYDSRTLMPIVLSGQTSLIDKLLFHTSRPFASRVVGRSHMEALAARSYGRLSRPPPYDRRGLAGSVRRGRRDRDPSKLGRTPSPRGKPRTRCLAGRR